MSAEFASNWIVITTINDPPAGIGELLTHIGDGWNVVVVGDANTPHRWHEQPVDFLSLERQRELFHTFATATPTNHYARKNLGYLYAAQRGATAILEVDDDGSPHKPFGTDVARTVRGRLIGGGDWANAYRWFTDQLIWPRGLPLDAVQRRGDQLSADAARECPVQQFLVDNDPDVDAIFRQLFPGARVTFDPAAAPVLLEPGTWCPFNTQNTLWFAEAFPLLYLPHLCNFRVTDIWRSLVAQRVLWLFGQSLAFHTATLSQTRNPHDLNRDFVDEIPAYTKNRAIAECLDHAARTRAPSSMEEVGRTLWLKLVDEGFLPREEAALIERWFDAAQNNWSVR